MVSITFIPNWIEAKHCDATKLKFFFDRTKKIKKYSDKFFFVSIEIHLARIVKKLPNLNTYSKRYVSYLENHFYRENSLSRGEIRIKQYPCFPRSLSYFFSRETMENRTKDSLISSSLLTLHSFVDFKADFEVIDETWR